MTRESLYTAVMNHVLQGRTSAVKIEKKISERIKKEAQSRGAGTRDLEKEDSLALHTF